MSTYGYIHCKGTKKLNSPKALWCLLGTIVLFLFWSAFKVALFNGQMSNFYEQPLYVAALFSAIIAIIAIVAGWELCKCPDRKDTLSLFVFLLPASFALSMLTAASQFLAANMLLIISMYSLFFIASSIIAKDNVISRIFSLAILVLFYIIVFFGLFHWLGNGAAVTTVIKWLGILTDSSGAYADAVMNDSNGSRLTSVFQYANTYAGFLVAFLLATLFFISKSQTGRGKFTHAFMIVPIILSIFLTLSRGGLLLFPIAFIIVLVFLKPHRQLMWVVHLAISGTITILILNPITEIGLHVQKHFSAFASFKGWAYIIMGSLLFAAISVVFERKVSPWLVRTTHILSNRRWGTLLIPIGGATLIGVILFVFIGTDVKNMLPESIAARLEAINFQQHSVLERITFYKDALKIIADYPLIGAGGDAWHALYEKYQNNPYISRQTHSFYVQYLVDTGIVGFFILMAFLLYIYWYYIRSYMKANEEQRDRHFLYFIVATSILLHSAIDINMSYVYIGILVFLCLGGMTAAIESQPLKRLKPLTFRTSLASILSIVGIGLFLTSILFIQASSSSVEAQKTLEKTRNFNQTMKHLRKALAIRPTHPYYAAFKSRLYATIYRQQQNELYFIEAEQVLKKASAANPYYKPLLKQRIALYRMKDRIKGMKGINETEDMGNQIYAIYAQNAAHFPWDEKWCDEYMDSGVREGYKSIATAPQKKNHYLNEVISTFEHVKAGVEHLKTLPKGQFQGNPFSVTPRMAINAGRAYIMQANPATAAKTMKPYLQENLADSHNRELVRWYVAATMQQGRVDQIWYDKLIAVDPNEKGQVEQIANMHLKA